MTENWQSAGFGLYIHWPFCAAKCPYCDFNSYVSADIDEDRWISAYTVEIERIGRQTPDRILSSVFFGGGTPSLMSSRAVDQILTAVHRTWTTANDLEITLEANPTSVEAERFADYKTAGINRVSIGVQALNDADLRALGRLHSVKEALAAVEIGRNTFDRLSFDLIYARQHQALDLWKAELSQALAMFPDHLSLYQLTIEDGTAFGERRRKGNLMGLPSEDLAADMYFLTEDMCDAAGLPVYEVSNHAKPGQESRHNMIYWRAGDFAGIGPGAHGRLTFGSSRNATETALSPHAWLDLVQRQGNGETQRYQLDESEVFSELVLMGLRTTEGINLDRLGKNGVLLNKINELCGLGMLETQHDRLSATRDGRAVLNTVVRELLADI